MASRKLVGVFGAMLHLCLCQITPELLPEFLAPLENHTVTQGRDVSFTCVVNHLQGFKVAWIKSDSRAILALHTHLVAHNPRLSVTHNGHNTWKLHVTNVQKNDSGAYMCQVNTDPMRSQYGYMEVVIPPDIMDDDSADGLIVHEGGTIRLRCRTTGTPTPNVTWRREDGRNITVRHEGQKQSVKMWEGEVLELTGVSRQEMGSYLCIASNRIPPSISKRYFVHVHFQPLIKVANQLVAAPIRSDVVLQCYVEASPHAMNTWHRDTGVKILSNDKYTITETPVNIYAWQMNLTIRNLEKYDLGGYICSAENALGKAEGTVRLQELHLPTKTTPATLTGYVDATPRKKHTKSRGRPKSRVDTIAIEPRTFGNEVETGTTQRMGGSTQNVHHTEKPVPGPSLSPPWVTLNSASSKRLFNEIRLLVLLLLFMVTH